MDKVEIKKKMIWQAVSPSSSDRSKGVSTFDPLVAFYWYPWKKVSCGVRDSLVWCKIKETGTK
jgi:hypothetical protein